MRVGGLIAVLLFLLAAAAASVWWLATPAPPPSGARLEPEHTETRAPPPPNPIAPEPASSAPPRASLHRPAKIHTGLSGRVLGLPSGFADLGWVGVTVAGEELRAPLDPEGRFRIWNLPAERSHDLGLGFGDGPVAIRLHHALRLERWERREIELTCREASILTGVVTDEGGRPVEGARFALVARDDDWRDPRTRIRATSARDGRFVVVESADLVGQEAKLVTEAVARGFLVDERRVQLTAGGLQRHDVRLTTGRRIAGRVVGPKDEPIPGADVWIEEVLDPDPSRAILPVTGQKKTDENGCFEDDAFRPGAYHLFVRGHWGEKPFLVIVESVPAGREDLLIRFRGFSTLTLGFRDARTSKAVPVGNGLLQRIHPRTGGREAHETWAKFHAKATVKLGGIPAGRYRVSLRHPGYKALTGEVFEIRAGKELGPVIYELEPRN